MKKIIIIFIYAIIFYPTIYAQQESVKLNWAKQISDSTGISSQSVTIDDIGNVYTVGFFFGTDDFDPGTGVFSMTSTGGCDVFISKLDSGGNFIWAKQMGGTYNDYGISIAVDNFGNVYTTGYFLGTADFNPGVDTNALSSVGGFDIFISKLDTGGNFVWVKQIGETNNDFGHSLTLDEIGNVYITGSFMGTVDFDTDSTTYYLSSIIEDVFILKLNTSGNFIWAKKVGGSGTDSGYSIKTDTSGSVYTTGTFKNTVDFNPADTLTYNLTSNGNLDIFILKLDFSGNFVWAKQFGGPSNDYCKSIFVDKMENVFTTGYFADTVDFDPDTSTFNLNSAGGFDIFISKLDSSGNFVWVKQFSGTSNEISKCIAVDTSGNVFTTGYFTGIVDFDPDTMVFKLTSVGSNDIFISKLDSAGSFIWAKQFGSTGDDKNSSITYDNQGNIYATGGIQYTVDVDPGVGILNFTSVSQNDMYVQKLTPCLMSSSAFSDSACGFYLFNGISLTSSGTYYDTLTNISGCDSIITLNLTINPIINTILSDTGCNSYNFNGVLLTSSGVYYDTLMSISGCDSTLILHLIVYSIDTSVTQTGITLTADVPGPSYQWVDCDNGYSLILGATNQSYTPLINGNYAVILTLNNCIDTSSCHLVLLTSIADNIPSKDIIIIPNPTNGVLYIDMNNFNFKVQNLDIFNIIGTKIYSTSDIKTINKVDLSNQSNGIYFVNIRTEKMNFVKKLVIQH